MLCTFKDQNEYLTKIKNLQYKRIDNIDNLD